MHNDTQILLAHSIMYGSFLAFPYLYWKLLLLRRRAKWRKMHIALIILALLFIWARFIEPQWIRVQESVIPNTRIHANVVLLADLHIGAYKNRNYLTRVVEKTNAISADINIIAGDFIYKIAEEQLAEILHPLANLNRPTYFVLGNHDAESTNTRTVLLQLGLIDLEHHIIDFGTWQLAGVGDRWGGNDRAEFDRPIAKKPLLIVAHNPDSVHYFSAQQTNLVLSGHTHCGQIRLPWIYKKVIPSAENHDCGLEYANNIPVFITAGLGEIGLPLRFLNPPTIEILRLHQ